METFTLEGTLLALIDLNATGLEDLAEALRLTGATVHTAVADLCTEQGVREGMLFTLAPYGEAIDVLVPNVGALIVGSFETLSSEHWQEAFAVLFFTHVYACCAAVLLMK